MRISSFISGYVLCGALTLCAVALPGFAVPAETRAFSFTDVEYMDPGARMPAVRQFIADKLPAGLSVQEAQLRAKAAALKCRVDQSGTKSAVCVYAIEEGGDGGTLGQAIWTVHLRGDASGRLQSVDVDRYRSGFEP